MKIWNVMENTIQELDFIKMSASQKIVCYK